jgi:hypothetical protein
MVIDITDDTMTLKIGGRVVATAGSVGMRRPTATARGSRRLTPPGCSPATRRSRRRQPQS